MEILRKYFACACLGLVGASNLIYYTSNKVSGNSPSLISEMPEKLKIFNGKNLEDIIFFVDDNINRASRLTQQDKIKDIKSDIEVIKRESSQSALFIERVNRMIEEKYKDLKEDKITLLSGLICLGGSIFSLTNLIKKEDKYNADKDYLQYFCKKV